VVDTKSVAVGNSIQDLEKGIFCRNIIPHIPTFLCNIAKEIPFWAIFHDNVGMFPGIHDSEKGDYVGMCGNLVV